MNSLMKNSLVYLLLLYALTVTSCTQKPDYGSPVVPPDAISKNMMAFLTYRERNVCLSEDFTALGPASEIITKDAFLNLLSSGDYLPLRLAPKANLVAYQLYKLDASANQDIRHTLQSWGSHEYALYKMEGTTFPKFEFIDLNGDAFSNETAKGKILVLKCWYIGCTACVNEMPALNALVAKYKDRSDILFVSLAFDSKEKLGRFLKKRTFNYSVVSDQEGFIRDVLKISMYPTHFIVNRQGMIAKVVNDEKALASALQKEESK